MRVQTLNFWHFLHSRCFLKVAKQAVQDHGFGQTGVKRSIFIQVNVHVLQVEMFSFCADRILGESCGKQQHLLSCYKGVIEIRPDGIPHPGLSSSPEALHAPCLDRCFPRADSERILNSAVIKENKCNFPLKSSSHVFVSWIFYYPCI